MARRRYLSTEISKDAALCRASARAGLAAVALFALAIPHADDDGTLPADSLELKLMVAPGLPMSQQEIEDSVAALVSEGLLLRGTGAHEGRLQYKLAAWWRAQSYVPEAKRRTAPDFAAEQRGTPQNSAERREVPKNTASPSPSPSPDQILSTPSGSHPSTAPEPAAVGPVLHEVVPGILASGPSQEEIERALGPDCGTCSIGLSKTTGECLGAAWATRRRHCAGQVVPGDGACRTLRSVAAQHSNSLGTILDEAQDAMEQDAHDQAIADELDRQAADEAQGVRTAAPKPRRHLLDAGQVIADWNSLATTARWTTTRGKEATKACVRAASRRQGFDAEWRELVAALEAKGWPWQLGKPGPHQDWKPSLEWVLQPKHMASLLDKLAAVPAPGAAGSSAPATPQELAARSRRQRWAGRDLVAVDVAAPCPDCGGIGRMACRCGLVTDAEDEQEYLRAAGAARATETGRVTA